MTNTSGENSMAGDEGRKTLAAAFLLVAGICLAGWALAWWIADLELQRTDLYQLNVFYYLYATYEPGTLVLLVLLAVLLYRLLSRRPATVALPAGLERWLRRPSPAAWLWLLAGLALAVSWLGAVWVYRQFPFSMDEFTVLFQARILAAGRLTAPVPEAWQPFARALTPLFVTYLPESQSWVSAYLPGYAAMLAPLVRLGAASLLNPLLAAASVFAVAGVVRNLWPERRYHQVVAALLLATSPQFLVTAMSGYTMPAHLCFNLVWLWLYTHRSRLARAAVPWVGLLAMGLHIYSVHALFAIPFLWRLVLERRLRLAAYYAGVYLFASALWVAWLWHVNPVAASATALGLSWISWLNQGASLAMLVSWQPLALTVLVVLGLCRWKQLPVPARDAAWSALLTFGFYFFFPLSQGHGWGNRYFHAALGNLAVLAVPGWWCLQRWVGRRPALGFVAVAAAFAVAVQLPIRAFEVAAMIAPFQRTQEYLAAQEEPVVLVYPASVWYGQDMVRNDPFLRNRPKVLFLDRLTRTQAERLSEMGQARILTPAELAELGMFPTAAPGS
jgi:hypothetical protein